MGQSTVNRTRQHVAGDASEGDLLARTRRQLLHVDVL